VPKSRVLVSLAARRLWRQRLHGRRHQPRYSSRQVVVSLLGAMLCFAVLGAGGLIMAPLSGPLAVSSGADPVSDAAWFVNQLDASLKQLGANRIGRRKVLGCLSGAPLLDQGVDVGITGAACRSAAAGELC